MVRYEYESQCSDSKNGIAKAIKELIKCIAPDLDDEKKLIEKICGGKVEMVKNSFVGGIFKDLGELSKKLGRNKGLILQTLAPHLKNTQ